MQHKNIEPIGRIENWEYLKELPTDFSGYRIYSVICKTMFILYTNFKKSELNFYL